MLRVGVIGAGWVASARHVPAFRRHPDVSVVAVFDRRPERAEAAASRWGIEPFSDLEAFFGRRLDIVSLCTPPWMHAEQAIDALERGVHVFTEKPMAMNEAQARSMVEAAEGAQRVLCVSHNFLFSRSVQRASELMPRSDLSYVSGLQLSSTSRRLPTWYADLPGGLLLDESPHMFYTLQHFLGPLELNNVRATFSPRTGLPATTEVQVTGPSGIGQVTMLFDTPLSEWHVSLVGESRVVGVDIFRDIVIDFGSDRAHGPFDILATSARAIAAHTKGTVTSGSQFLTRRLLWGHEVIIAKFVDAILGRGPTPVAAADALGVVRLTDDILAELNLVPAKEFPT